MMFLIVCVIAFTLFVFGWLAFHGVNEIGISSPRVASTVVSGKRYTEGFYTYTYVNGAMVPTYNPEQYYVHFTAEDKPVSMSVSAQFYFTIAEGDKIKVDYGYGRLNGEIVAKKITKLN